MKIGLAGIIGGQQLTGDASGLGAGESALFASMVRTASASSAAKPAWMNGKTDSYNMFNAETSEANALATASNQNEDLLAAAFAPLNLKASDQVTAMPGLSFSSTGGELSEFGSEGLTESGFEAGLNLANSVSSEGETLSASDIAKPTTIPARLGTTDTAATVSNAPSPGNAQSLNVDTASSGIRDAEGVNILSVEADAEPAMRVSSETETSFSATLAQTVSRNAMTAGNAQTAVNANTVAAAGSAAQPVLGNTMKQAGLVSEVSAERDSEGGEISVAAIAAGSKASAQTGLTNTGVATQTTPPAPNTSSVQTGTAQTAPIMNADAQAKPAVQMAEPTLLSQSDEGFELIDTDSAALDEGIQTQTQRTDARIVEAAAQNAVRGSNAPQMAALVSRIGEQFLERFTGKTSTFEIRLDPPELGKVDIRVEVGTDGKVMAVLAARDPSVADALMRGAKTLENALTQAGLNLSEGGVQVELDQKNSSAFANQSGEDVAEEYQGVNSPVGEDLAEAGEDTPLTPVIETWSRRRLDLTA